jgi:hypothetical protein
MRQFNWAFLSYLCLAFAKNYIIYDGDIYPKPETKVTVDIILNDPKFKNFSLRELPEAFWRRQQRRDFLKLASVYSFPKFLETFDNSKIADYGEAMMFGKNGDFLLYEPVRYGPTGDIVLKTTIDSTEPLNIFGLRENLLEKYGRYLMPHMTFDHFISFVDSHSIFQITKYYNGKILEAAMESDFEGDMREIAEDSLSQFLLELLKNEGLENRFDVYQVKEVAGFMINNNDDIQGGFLKWGLLNKRTDESLMHFILDRMHKFVYMRLKESGDHHKLLKFMLMMWRDDELVPSLVSNLVDEIGLDQIDRNDFQLFLTLPVNLHNYDSLMIAGVLTGKMSIDELLAVNSSFENILVRDEISKAISIEKCVQHLTTYAKAFSWLSISKKSVKIPIQLIDQFSSKLVLQANEALLSELVLREETRLLPWFCQHFGLLKFHAASKSFKKKIADKNREIGFLVFPDQFDFIPPVTFSKHALMLLTKISPVRGELDEVMVPIRKVLELKIDSFSIDELLELQAWGRKSNLGYRVGNLLFYAINKKGYMKGTFTIKQISADFGLEQFKESFDIFRLPLSWTNDNIEAEFMQRFERYVFTLGLREITFLKHTTPERSHVTDLLRQRYCNLIKTPNCNQPDLQKALSEINDPVEIVRYSQMPFDEDSRLIIKSRFLSLEYQEEVWNIIRTVPIEDAGYYLTIIKLYNNVPLGYMEHLRYQKGIAVKDLDAYLLLNVARPAVF